MVKERIFHLRRRRKWMHIPVEILEEFWASRNLWIVLLFIIYIFTRRGTTFVFFDRYLPSTSSSPIEQVKQEWIGKIREDFLSENWVEAAKRKGSEKMWLNVKKRACLSELGVQKKGGADNPAQADGLRDALGSHLTCVCILDKLSFWINHSLIFSALIKMRAVFASYDWCED